MHTNRIPSYGSQKYAGMVAWFSKMLERELIFHPDDDAARIECISDGSPFFSPEEAKDANEILDAMFDRFGDRVYEAAYPFFMLAVGNIPEARW